MILQSLAGLPGFLAYFCTAFVITIGYRTRGPSPISTRCSPIFRRSRL
jgi:hypothetical protein